MVGKMGKKILVVDDAAFLRKILVNMLMDGGYEVVGEAFNGLNAIELYKEFQPNAVFMDITMPEMDGIVATSKIKKLDPNAIIIMCPAAGQHMLLMQAIQAGAKDYIEKPFQKERVMQVLEKAFKIT